MSLPMQPSRTSGRPSTAPTPEALQRALTRAAAPPVEVRESFASWVALTDERAYRLHKHLRLPSADLTTYEGRLFACRAIAAADQALGGDVVLGVRSIVPVGDSFALAAERHGDAVDHVVEMRRYAREATLAYHVADSELPGPAAEAIGRRLAALHADVAVASAEDAVAAARGAWHGAVDRLATMSNPLLPPRRLAAIERFADAFVRARSRQLRDRAGARRVRDGHGDLRPSHVLLERERIRLVGREVYDPALRRVDVGDDLSTLMMELELLGASATAEAVVAAYRDAGGDPGDRELLAFWAARRALVAAARRCASAGVAVDEARRYAELAERLVWRARGPVAIVVCGRPPDGRRRVATTLAGRSAWPLLHGDDALEGLAGPTATNVVVEHPLATVQSQRAIVDALRRTGHHPRVVECRARTGLHTAIVPDVAARHRLVVDPEGDAEDMVDEVAAWLDTSLRDVAPPDRLRHA